jgi:microcystin-dependent protein
LNATGGLETHLLTAAESGVPAHQHANTVTNNEVNTGDDAPDHTHNYTAVGASGTTISSGVGTIVGTASSGGANQRHIHAVTSNVTITNVNNTAASAASAHNNMQPFRVVNFIIKHD